MVSYIPYGRMGNVLFMAANMIAYAWRNGLEYSMPGKTMDSFHNPLYLQHLVNPKWDPSLPVVRLKEPHFHYTPMPFDENWRNNMNILFDGYFQSEKYFADFRNAILHDFDYRWEMKKGYVSCHVRRTDYVNLTEKHPPVTKEWYEEAMSMFPGFKFIFYSDDIDWCRENFGDRPDCGFEHVGIEPDLINASCCEHQICSASSYSWWIMWLNRNVNKIVIFPKKWFTDGWDGADTKDILPDYVIKL